MLSPAMNGQANHGNVEILSEVPPVESGVTGKGKPGKRKAEDRQRYVQI